MLGSGAVPYFAIVAVGADQDVFASGFDSRPRAFDLSVYLSFEPFQQA